MRFLTVVVLGACIALTPCLADAQSRAELSREDAARIGEVTQAFEKAVMARNFKVLAALYADDAVLYPPGETAVKGRTSIETCLAALPALTDFKLRNTKVDGHDDIAYIQGTYFMTAMDGSEEVEDSGYYLEVRRKQPDGRWLIAVHMLLQHESAR